MIEAELKAHLREPERIRQALRALPAEGEEMCVYHDTYYDAAADPASGSKPEWETAVEEPEAIDAILRGLGFEHDIAFEKHCTNYTFHAQGRRLQATLARVPELDGSFLEVETLVEDNAELQPALDAIHRVLDDLRIPRSDLTNELYTDLVRRQRAAA